MDDDYYIDMVNDLEGQDAPDPFEDDYSDFIELEDAPDPYADTYSDYNDLEDAPDPYADIYSDYNDLLDAPDPYADTYSDHNDLEDAPDPYADTYSDYNDLEDAPDPYAVTYSDNNDLEEAPDPYADNHSDINDLEELADPWEDIYSDMINNLEAPKPLHSSIYEYMESAAPSVPVPTPRVAIPGVAPHPKVILPYKIIKKIEDKLNETEEEISYHIKDFQKFYEESLKSSFKDLLKRDAPILDNEYNEGTSLNKDTYNSMSPMFSEVRSKLPVFQHAQEILTAVRTNTFVLINGETGSGKTTQIPQIILNDHLKRGEYCHIICTQPRRISAISVAERVAKERAETIGTSVGYQIRLEYYPPRPADSILFCTTGILLRKLISDPLLANVSHIILDEIHERNIESDLLVGLLKEVVNYNKKLKVLLMSATFGFEDFEKYFVNPKIVRIQGSAFPVEIKYLEDVLNELNFFDFQRTNRKRPSNYYTTPEGREEFKKEREFSSKIIPFANSLPGRYSYNVRRTLQNPATEELNLNLIKELINYIDRKLPQGAILVFLPGYEKIFKLHETLSKYADQYNKNFKIFTLHSMMPTDEQKEIFDRPPPGTRKIILATNIAETSITIDDVVYVINPGKVKVKHYDIKNKVETLEEYWVTRANSIQRQGRAGRCQPGICYHLYTSEREKLFDEYPKPEIQRARLESVILNLKELKIHNVKEFLKTLVSAPHETAVENGIHFLKRINALDKNGILTPLGLHMSQLPIDPQVGKMLLLGSIFQCLDPITTIAATLSVKEPFRRIVGKEKEMDQFKMEFSEGSKSDHITFVNILKEFRKAVENNNTTEFCFDNFIVEAAVRELEKMKIRLCDLLQTVGFIEYAIPEHSASNSNSDNICLLRAIITAGLFPNIGFLSRVEVKNQPNKATPNVFHTIHTPEDGENVKINLTSVNRKERNFESKYLVYFNKHKVRKNIFLHDTTMTYPLPIILFADVLETGCDASGYYFISTGSHLFRFSSDKKTVDIILKLRFFFENLLRKIALDPHTKTNCAGHNKNVIDAMIMLLTYQEGD